MSAIPPKADIGGVSSDVRFVPKADILHRGKQWPNGDEIDAAFKTLVNDRADGLLVAPDAFFVSRHVQIAILSARHQVPAIYPTRDYAEAGGLISYGADLIDAREVALTSGQAAARLGQLLDSGSKRLDATKFALGVAGIKPVDDARLSVSIELRAGYVIDLSESGRPEQKIVGGQVIDAKPIDG